jgi:hypothetical protein
MRTRTRLAGTLVVATVLALFGSSEGALASPESPLADLLKTKYTPATKVDQIPRPVRNALLALDPRGMANPGEDFNAGCVQGAGPGRRLILAGGTPTRWFVFFEQGGFVTSRHLVVLEVNHGKAVCSYSCSPSTNVSTFEGLSKAVEEGNVSCAPCATASSSKRP